MGRYRNDVAGHYFMDDSVLREETQVVRCEDRVMARVGRVPVDREDSFQRC